ncbi:hypothetical protein I4F81_003445 [Pyropia yezoensis]|uniref:Uncharacterized protein n=1 Tax=Pyropia yezoensis TaxID=2788 RepID=A0ACC3BT27_PYRYE|nr:hypothetical protein I4F81_003445 [Neopyropia yezoensis]
MAAAVAALLSVRPPALAVYTEPLRPSADLSLRDRATLVAHSVRPWGEFFDPSAFAFPAWGDAGLRVVANVETYFFNYVAVGAACLAAAAAAHVGSALVLAALVGLAVALYVVAPPVVTLPGGVTVGAWGKGALMAAAAWAGIAYGHVGVLGGVVAGATAAIVGVHALFRDHQGG